MSPTSSKATSTPTSSSAGSRSAALLAAAFIAGLFFYCAAFGLRTPFGYDDITNITVAWQPPLRELAVALVVPFTSFYRPAGSAVYRFLFDLFGLNPLPFRVFVYTLLLLNLFLVYRLAQRLSGSKEIGALSALLYTFHGRLSLIYLNNGTLYDVLCATLTFLTLLYYLDVRQAGRRIQLWYWLKLLALFVCALNSKEMAALVPVLLIVYELLYETKRQYLPGIVCAALTIRAAWAKAGGSSVMHGNPAYAMTFTATQFLQHWQKLMNAILYAKGRGLTIPRMLILWLLLLAVAAILRKKHLWFFIALAFLGPMPVIFIPWRGFFVMYLPYAGWCMLAATLLVSARQRIPKIPPAALFLPVAVFIAWKPRHDPASELGYRDPAHPIIQAAQADLIGLNEPLRQGAMILFLHDRFPPNVWGTLMMARLLYRDPTLWADTPKMMDHPPVLTEYDHVFDYVDGKLVVVSSRGSGSLRPH